MKKMIINFHFTLDLLQYFFHFYSEHAIKRKKTTSNRRDNLYMIRIIFQLINDMFIVLFQEAAL
ncbi:Uncharacterised protein [Bartonella vinsonii]|uniref:Transposase n=1 Tax=Bartonella vinsonii TaxID=33047 RepID=A0A448V6U4_BARVI|nr:Uncharacterised protein [Bartonella vinsonii]